MRRQFKVAIPRDQRAMLAAKRQAEQAGVGDRQRLR